MLNEADLRTVHEASVALRLTHDDRAKYIAAQIEASKVVRQAAWATACSRIFAAVIIAAAIYGSASSFNHRTVASPVNGATHSDVSLAEQCIRSDWAVYFTGAPPDPACGPPPGNPTIGRKP
jgi:hypothetical protein